MKRLALLALLALAACGGDDWQERHSGACESATEALGYAGILRASGDMTEAEYESAAAAVVEICQD